ncbi:MAG: hypothetical protein JOZ47_09410 [Kutzneria sp.]|nr:hypothetical protein [Kutzneria sp.]
MGMKRLRRQCAKVIDTVEIPDPFDVRELSSRIGQRRGRPIHLIPYRMPAGGPCGLWVSTDNADYIVYEEHTSTLHREHIILHELGHLLCDHQMTPAHDGEPAGPVFPSLDPRTVERVLQRTHYTAVEEQQAELIASLILERVSRWAPSRYPPSNAREISARDADTIDRIRRSLGDQG